SLTVFAVLVACLTGCSSSSDEQATENSESQIEETDQSSATGRTEEETGQATKEDTSSEEESEEKASEPPTSTDEETESDDIEEQVDPEPSEQNEETESDDTDEQADPEPSEQEEEQPAEEAEEQQPAEEAEASVPGAPTGLTKTSIGNGQVTVTWDAPTDTGSSPIVSYTVARTLNGGADGTCVPTTTSCTLIDQFPPENVGTNTYTYTVYATNSVGDGPESAAITHLEETVATIPGTPTWVSATGPDIASFTVQWAAPTDTGGSPIISYTVARTLNGDADGTCVPTTTSCTLTGHSLPGGFGTNTYTYTVFATNSVGDGPPSAPIIRECFRGPDFLDENNNMSPGPMGCNGDF
ncbi:MAG: fibronectin type III domain-containing protein, partial [Acidimicrobiales bacterium]|nr:fibronectin type III domain-containing protein [Acidimicrobiales bacterium]